MGYMANHGKEQAVGQYQIPVMRHDFVATDEVGRPEIMLGISWNSGTGKTTTAQLCSILTVLTDTGSIIHLEGDGAHLYPRWHHMREHVTHLDPAANDLQAELAHLLNLRAWDKISRREYDHESGTFTDPVEIEPRRGVIVYTWLHSLYSPELREVFDLTMFMEPDQNLAKHQKIVRDIKERWHPKEKIEAQIQRRQPDKERHIDPQWLYADIIVKLYPKRDIPASDIWNPDVEVELNIQFKIKEEIDVTPLLDRLQRVEHLIIQHEHINTTINRNILSFCGMVSSEELTHIVADLFPETSRRLQHFPLEQWINGLIQVVALYVANYKLQKKSN